MRGAAVDSDWAGPVFDLVAHALAHVRVDVDAPAARAASLFDAGYVAWARDALPTEAVDPIAVDAPLVAAGLRTVDEVHALSWLLVLFDDLARLRSAAAVDLSALTPGHVASATAQGALRQAGAAVEILRCAIALSARPYAAAWERLVRPALDAERGALDRALALAARCFPGLGRVAIRLSHPLGARGRVFPTGLWLGFRPGAAGSAPDRVAVRAAHELCVREAGAVVAARVAPSSGAVAWALTEDLALEAAARRVAGSPLEPAFEAFVSELDLRGLSGDAREHLGEVLDRLGS